MQDTMELAWRSWRSVRDEGNRRPSDELLVNRSGSSLTAAWQTEPDAPESTQCPSRR